MPFTSYYKLVKYSKPLPFYVQDVSGSANSVRIECTDTDIIASIETSTDNSTWTHPIAGVDIIDIPVPANGRVYLRCSADTWHPDFSINAHFASATGNFKAGGNIMSLLYGSNYTGSETSFPSGTTNNFYGLFGYNGSLTDASDLELPATTLTEGCYDSMFNGCSALTAAPALPATTLAPYCYSGMFIDCTSLTQTPELPATTATNCCYNSMFNGCTSLTQASALPATTLANNCYQYMFQNCSSLATAPSLPATTLAGSCYTNMFHGCSNLTQAPVLPAAILAEYCYDNMFQSCSSLDSVTCLAEDITASGCTSGWLDNVAATGTFYKSPNMSSWTTGWNGIPSGWTVQDAQ